MVFSGREGGGWGAADQWRRPSSLFSIVAVWALIGLALSGLAAPAHADDPFATAVLDYDPAPGQFVNDVLLKLPGNALGPPSGGGSGDPNETGVVTLGGFGGTITLAFDRTVFDEASNPLGLDAIVFGNAFWLASNANRRWGEVGVIEISRDANSNGLADDAWFLIPGSHITDPVGQFATQTWDDNFGDAMFPPANPFWVPAGQSGTWMTEAYLLPDPPFGSVVVENPNGLLATEEGVFGYADMSPVMPLPDGVDADVFYVRPDDPFRVGVTPGSGGGDAFDIAWAIDPVTGMDAAIDGFDFIRIRTSVDLIVGALGEVSTEIDAVADVAAVSAGDVNGDGFVDLDDYGYLFDCLQGPQAPVPTSPCRAADLDDDGDVDLEDAWAFQERFDG